MNEEKQERLQKVIESLNEQIEEVKEDAKMVEAQPEYPWNRDVRRKVLGLKKYNFARRIFKGKRIQGLAEKIMTTTIRQAQLEQIVKTEDS